MIQRAALAISMIGLVGLCWATQHTGLALVWAVTLALNLLVWRGGKKHKEVHR